MPGFGQGALGGVGSAAPGLGGSIGGASVGSGAGSSAPGGISQSGMGITSPTAPVPITNSAGERGVLPATRGSALSQQEGAAVASESVERNEFQDLVTQSLGRVLPLFGYTLFQGVPSTFAPIENVPVTADYTIGPGDELVIRAWGQIDIDYRAVVDRAGTINIPRIGVINVAGIKYQGLTDYIKTAVARNFRNFDLVVNMGQLRSMQILVVGQAKRPGNYTVSSLSTLVNAIFAAGGPSVRGSMRSIQLKRGNQTVSEMDLYDLLVFGDKSQDRQLLPGDVIYFPPVGPLAALSGSVNNPAIFELKGDTSLDKLVQWAGGLTTIAQTRLAAIERIKDRYAREVEQFSLDSGGLKKPIRDGDVVSVFSITPKFENVVSLRGNVAAPLRYPFTQGMRVRDLIPEREALITADYYVKKNMIVRSDFRGPDQLRIDIRRSLSEINWDYAVIERLSDSDLTINLIPFNLGKAVIDGDPSNNLLLKPGDVVTVFSKGDIQVGVAKQTKYVRIEGEFNNGGLYQILPSETLRQLVTRIGGFSQNAYLFGAQFTRASTRVQQQKNLDEAINRLERDMQRLGNTQAQSVISSEDSAAHKQQAESQQRLIARLRQVRPSGRIVLEMPPDATLKDLPDLLLEDDDQFVVPSSPSMVNILGAVYNESSYLYRPDKRFADYLSQAGGPSQDADKSNIYLQRADGTVISKRQSGFFVNSLESIRMMPGDSIIVPEELEKTSLMKNLKDITQIFYQFGLGAAAIKVLKN